MHHFHTVAVVQQMLGVTTARHDAAVDLHGHTPFAQSLQLQQLRDAAGIGQIEGLAIEVNAHACSMPASSAANPNAAPMLHRNAKIP